MVCIGIKSACEQNLRTFGPIASGPIALDGSRDTRARKTSDGEIEIESRTEEGSLGRSVSAGEVEYTE